MNHGGMDHSPGGHGPSHGGMDSSMPMKCSMNMLWNSQVAGTCVVFERWSIQTWWGMLVSCIAVTGLSFIYLHLLHISQQQDKRTAIQLYLGQRPEANFFSRSSMSAPSSGDADGNQGPVRGESPMPGARGGNLGIQKLPTSVRLSRAILYALTMSLSFFVSVSESGAPQNQPLTVNTFIAQLMLVAMTYNTYLFISIILGGFLGHWTYESEMDVGAVMNGQQAKGYACH